MTQARCSVTMRKAKGTLDPDPATTAPPVGTPCWYSLPYRTPPNAPKNNKSPANARLLFIAGAGFEPATFGL